MRNNLRYNAININSLLTYSRVKGNINNGTKDVYFVRLLGTNSTLAEDLLSVDRILSEGMEKGQLIYKRVNSMPTGVTMDNMAYYVDNYEQWIRRGKKELNIKISENNPEFAFALSEALECVLKVFCRAKASVSPSIERNFSVKLMGWADEIFETGKKESDLYMNRFKNWNYALCVKIIAANVAKEQEYLFYYFLTLLGMDVLLLQTREDVKTSDAMKELSAAYRLGQFSSIAVPDYVKKVKIQSSIQGDRPVLAVSSMVRPRKISSVRSEKSFEELARLASSVVMIGVHSAKGELLGTGSGIMIGREGYILTNFHVVKGGPVFEVRIEDDENTYTTDELIKYNPVFDLAIIRIDKSLNPLPLYQGPDKLVRGQRVVAIGSPLGLFNSVSDGIISGFRVIDSEQMIQFTAPISHGSSGGAVLNMYGEVIGISTAGIDSGQNLNLAVPYDCIRDFARGFY